jgi:hypothetical protein
MLTNEAGLEQLVDGQTLGGSWREALQPAPTLSLAIFSFDVCNFLYNKPLNVNASLNSVNHSSPLERGLGNSYL